MQYSDKILKTPSSFIRNILKVTGDAEVISFAGGLPNPISFPIEAMQASITRSIEEHGAKLFQYSTTQGYLPLREYIANKLNKQGDYGYTADDILITTGSQQALEMIDQYNTEWLPKEAKKYLSAMETEPHNVKLYFDAGFERDTKFAGLGVVVYFEQSGAKYRIRQNAPAHSLMSHNVADYAAHHLACRILEELEVPGQEV